VTTIIAAAKIAHCMKSPLKSEVCQSLSMQCEKKNTLECAPRATLIHINILTHTETHTHMSINLFA